MHRYRWTSAAVTCLAAIATVTALAACEAAPAPSASDPAPGAPFDPLSARLTVPDVAGLHVEEHTTSAEAERLMLSDLGPQGVKRLVEVTLQPSGYGSPGDGEATDPVHGRAAMWLDGAAAIHQYDGERLAFTWADDVWAYVAAAAPNPNAPADGATLRQLVRAVAEALVVGPAAKVALPFVAAADLPGVSDTVVATGTQRLWSLRVPPGEPFVRASLSLIDPDVEPRHGGLSIAAVSDGRDSYQPGTGNATVNGRTAYDSGTGTVVVFDHADGFSIEITAAGEADLMLLAGSVTVVDGAADESQWTVDYLLP